MPITNQAKDMFVAPHMSAFKAAEIPDMSSCDPHQEHWVSMFILNSLLRGDIETRARQYIFNYLRRAELAFREYGLARERTLRYLAAPDAASNYVAAIGHWEVFLSQAWHSLVLLTALAGGGRKSLFVMGDGSVLERLNAMYNRAKHAEEAIGRGEFPEEGTLPVWMEDAGLRSTNSHLSWEEMASILNEDLAKWANLLQDPSTMAGRARELAKQDEGDAGPTT